jgi:hypothetical protein
MERLKDYDPNGIKKQRHSMGQGLNPAENAGQENKSE